MEYLFIAVFLVAPGDMRVDSAMMKECPIYSKVPERAKELADKNKIIPGQWTAVCVKIGDGGGIQYDFTREDQRIFGRD